MPERNRTTVQNFVIGLDKALTFFENFISITCFTVMVVLVVAGIVSRFILHIPFMWVEEASRYFMVAGVYLGVSMGVREKFHLGLNALVDSLPPAPQRVLQMSLTLGVTALCLFFSVCSFSFMMQVQSTGQTSPAMQFPMWIAYIPLGTGFVFGTIRGLMIFWNDYICKTPVLSYENSNVQAN